MVVLSPRRTDTGRVATFESWDRRRAVGTSVLTVVGQLSPIVTLLLSFQESSGGTKKRDCQIVSQASVKRQTQCVGRLLVALRDGCSTLRLAA